jgi:hypothetical protein
MQVAEISPSTSEFPIQEVDFYATLHPNVYYSRSALLDRIRLGIWHEGDSHETGVCSARGYRRTRNAAFSAKARHAAIGHSQPDQPATKAMVVTGMIVKSGSYFVLRDSSGAVYQLDAQEKAQPDEGKSVKITGKLEAEAKFLHVETIEELNG